MIRTLPTLSWSLAATTLMAILIAICAQVAVPMVPVPMTMQSFAVLLAGAWLGPVWGTLAALLYLAAAALGAPVLSEASGGLARFAGPTAGYLFAFPLAAALAGLAARGGRLRPPAGGVAVLIAVHGLILALGVVGLMVLAELTPARAVATGAAPFLIGAAIKSVLVWGVVRLWPGPSWTI